MWEALKYINSWYALVAFIAILVMFVIRHLSSREKHLIEAAPTEKRSKLIDKTLELNTVDTSKLPETKKFELAKDLIQKRDDKHKRWHILAVFIVLCVFIYSIMNNDKFPIISTRNPQAGAGISTPVNNNDSTASNKALDCPETFDKKTAFECLEKREKLK